MLNGFYLEIVLAVKVTLAVSIGATFVGIIGGLLSALLEKIPLFGKIFLLWNMLIRGVPELLVLFGIYFGLTTLLSQITGNYVEINALSAGIAALGIIFAAYASQVFIAALSAIDQGEINAGLALGMRQLSIFHKIILPQIWRHAIPGLFNLWLVVLKDSSIVSLIGLKDMMQQAQVASSQQFEPFSYYLFVGFIYLILTAGSQGLAKLISQISRKGHYA